MCAGGEVIVVSLLLIIDHHNLISPLQMLFCYITGKLTYSKSLWIKGFAKWHVMSCNEMLNMYTIYISMCCIVHPNFKWLILLLCILNLSREHLTNHYCQDLLALTLGEFAFKCKFSCYWLIQGNFTKQSRTHLQCCTAGGDWCGREFTGKQQDGYKVEKRTWERGQEHSEREHRGSYLKTAGVCVCGCGCVCVCVWGWGWGGQTKPSRNEEWGGHWRTQVFKAYR